MYDKIRALPKDIADKIAAGEVVERPLSIVKELLENSIDAGSTSIIVEIRKGGKEYIRVTDNGCGIHKDELSLAFMRYATSKIFTDDDLNAIQSLGFRGEALASIAAVSKIELVTKTADEASGSRIALEGGEIIEITEAACQDGTTIVVRDLFYNIPARKKFLKQDNAESSLVTDYVSKMAIAYPNVRFRLVNNGTILYSTLGNNSLKQAIMTVFSPDITRKIIPVEYSAGDMHISGFVSSPSECRNNRRYQIFFVNGRLIRSSLIEKALDEAYRDKVFDGKYPAAFLFLEEDPSKLDVNIHPSKTEIRFFEEDAVRDFLVRSVRRALLDPGVSNVVPKTEDNDNNITSTSTNEQKSETVSYGIDQSPSPKVSYVSVREDPEAKPFFADLRAERTEEQQSFEVQEKMIEEKAAPRLRFSDLELIGSVFDTYIIAKDPDHLYMLDQHAAHERVLFEKLRARFSSRDTESQMLLAPYVLHLSPAAKIAALDLLEPLGVLGYEIDDFGAAELIVKAVPSCMSMAEAEAFLESMLEDEKLTADKFELKRDEIISNSCKAAIKGGDRISAVEAMELLRQLDGCENPYNCPHGRPTYIRYSRYDLERLFLRK
jgi:DNA mismatch repair protein MutL